VIAGPAWLCCLHAGGSWEMDGRTIVVTSRLVLGQFTEDDVDTWPA
jgi:hypothetical protein